MNCSPGLRVVNPGVLMEDCFGRGIAARVGVSQEEAELLYFGNHKGIAGCMCQTEGSCPARVRQRYRGMGRAPRFHLLSVALSRAYSTRHVRPDGRK